MVIERPRSLNLSNLRVPGQFLIFCDGGLANRINSMISGMVLAERLNRSYRIIWPQNNRCEAPFSELFDMNVFNDDVRLIDFLPLEDSFSLWLHENDIGFKGEVTNLRRMKLNEVNSILENAPVKTIFFSENSILPWLPDIDVKRHLRDLKFHYDFLYQAQEVLETNRIEKFCSYVSVHLRGTDFPQEAPVRQVKAVIEQQANQLFYVCSDEKAIEAQFEGLPNVFIHKKSSFVEKQESGPWRSEVKDSDGLPYTSNIKRESNSVKAAVVDLILLASGQTLPTSQSSFLRLANLLRESGWAETIFNCKTSSQTSSEEIRALIRTLKPRAFKNDYKVRVGAHADGGYVLPSCALSSNLVLSIGIGDQVSFDLAMANRGATVYQYDHTIERQPAVHKNFRYFKKGWGSKTTDELITLSSMVEMIDWNEARCPILKFDVEGAEWEALLLTQQEVIEKFEIIVGEFHYFHNLIGRGFFKLVYQIFKKLSSSHLPAHIHPNNATGVRLINGIPFPPLLEITWCKKSMVNEGEFSRDPIPGPLDFPNLAGRPDIFLSLFSDFQ